MADRRYVGRESWESVPPAQLTSAELRHGVDRATGQVEAYRVAATEGDRSVTLEVLWLVRSRRAGIATPEGVFWTETPTIETALHRWSGDISRGTRTNPRE